MKKNLALAISSLLVLALALTGCTSEPASSAAPASGADASADTAAASGVITVITREDGSGTRGAFVEITGVMEDDVDNTSVNAVVHDGTGKVLTAVANDPGAIGYISLGSLNETVKALSVDGVAPTNENVQNGTYALARPFNIATLQGAELSAATQDFMAFIMSAEGQAVVGENGFIPVEDTGAFESAMPEGNIVVGGSTSVYPVMEKLKEAYLAINPGVTISIEGIGSTGGMTGAQEGTFDIGMASRELKEEELAVLEPTVIAQDGIAMIVNLENSLENITMEQIKGVYTEAIVDFSELA